MPRDEAHRDFARGLRNNPTGAERNLWNALRAQQLAGDKFRRQAVIGRYVVDFVCFSHKLVVELDGPQHLEDEARQRDKGRTFWLESQGFRVIRFRNHELDDGVQRAAAAILAALEKSTPDTGAAPLPNPPHRGEGAG